jgi:hypothetical protein
VAAFAPFYTRTHCKIQAWVLGAADPTSGTASIHETIRGFGELLKKGWKPMRTIVFASWDAEEVGSRSGYDKIHAYIFSVSTA